MVEIIDPKKDEAILDPACGTAGFLISSYKHVLKHNTKGYQARREREAYEEQGVSMEVLTLDTPRHYSGDLLTPDDRKRLATNIHGYDISPDMVRLSLVNMYLHGFTDPHIEEYDTLTSDEKWNELADVILANPPFMSPKGGIKPHKRFSVDSKRSEVLFVDYIAEHLTPNGRAAVVVPEGIIFQSQTAYKQLREMLVKNYPVAVVSLPAGVFNPYSGVKTSILVLNKRLAKKSDDILFVKIDNDGFNLGAQRRPIDKNDLPAAVEIVKAFRHSRESGNPEDFDPSRHRNALVVEKERIGENGEWNLSGERYAKVTARISSYELVSLGQACSRVKQNITPSEHSGFVNYIGLENIESVTGNILGNIVADYSDIKSTKAIFQVDDVLYGKLRPNLNKVYLARMDGICSTDIFAYRVHYNCIPEYLSYVMRSAHFNTEVLKGLSGAQLPRVSSTYLDQIKIPLPPLEVQKEIVAEIEGYQKVIDGARRVVEIYQPRILIHPDWSMVELQQLCEITSSKRIFQNEYVDIGIPFYRTKEIVELSRGKEISLELFISKERFAEIREKFSVPNEGDILVSAVGTIGVSWVVSDDREFYFKDGNLLWLRQLKNIEPSFLKLSLDDFFSRKLHTIIAGAAYNALTIVKLKQVAIPLPDLDTQRAIVTEIEEEQRLVAANKELINRFEEKVKQTISRVWGEAE